MALRALSAEAALGGRLRFVSLAWREPLAFAAVAGAIGAAILWFGPPGADTAAHVYQLHLFRTQGFVTWDNYWYSGRYVFVTYSWLYYPLASIVGIKLLAALSLAVAVVLLARIPDFAWDTFFLVAKWSLLGYIVIAGMIEYAFIHDDTPGSTLAAMSAMLALFAIDVPMLLGFSVARYAGPAS
jgi:hypothetical protein